jgi:uncharacterized protein (DUF2384 family)
MTKNAEAQPARSINHEAAFKVGNKILEKWGCSATQKWTILGIPKSSFYRYQKNASTITLNSEQFERLSYIANIHHALRMLFSKNENAYGFMSMVNYNPYFNGKTPLSIISTGRFSSLYEVCKRIRGMINV